MGLFFIPLFHKKITMNDFIRSHPRLSIILTLVISILGMVVCFMVGFQPIIVQPFFLCLVIYVTNIAKETLPLTKRLAKMPKKFTLLILLTSLGVMFSSLYYRLQLLMAAAIATVIGRDVDIDVMNAVCFTLVAVPFVIYFIKTSGRDDVKVLKIRYSSACFFITYCLGGLFISTVMFDVVSPFSESQGEYGFYTGEIHSYGNSHSWHNMLGIRYVPWEHAELCDTVFYSNDSTAYMVYSLYKDKRYGWLETVSGDFNKCTLKIDCKYQYIDDSNFKMKETKGENKIEIKISKLDKKDIEEYEQRLRDEKRQDSIMVNSDANTFAKYIVNKRVKSSTDREKVEYKFFDTTAYKLTFSSSYHAFNCITDERVKNLPDGLHVK